MAAKELYDYMSDMTADHNYTLSVDPQAVLTENIFKNQVIVKADDGSEEILSFSSDPIPYLDIRYDILDESDAGTVYDYYMDTAKGDGVLYSFYFDHPDNHTYVVRFDGNISRQKRPTMFGFNAIRLRVLGRKTEA